MIGADPDGTAVAVKVPHGPQLDRPALRGVDDVRREAAERVVRVRRRGALQPHERGSRLEVLRGGHVEVAVGVDVRHDGEGTATCREVDRLPAEAVGPVDAPEHLDPGVGRRPALDPGDGLQGLADGHQILAAVPVEVHEDGAVVEEGGAARRHDVVALPDPVGTVFPPGEGSARRGAAEEPARDDDVTVSVAVDVGHSRFVGEGDRGVGVEHQPLRPGAEVSSALPVDGEGTRRRRDRWASRHGLEAAEPRGHDFLAAVPLDVTRNGEGRSRQGGVDRVRGERRHRGRSR
ncbi:hypothetical protein L1856_08735 [Streptomyces sp. Tue 6430]|nr:hypothetical protein [Streptomyces sp. Tue 6430]